MKYFLSNSSFIQASPTFPSTAALVFRFLSEMNEAALIPSLSCKVLQLVTFDGVISDPSFIGVTECRIILGGV